MKTKFPKLEGFLPKVKPAKNEKKTDEKNKKIDPSLAYVYKGHLIATNGQIFIIFNLKEYMKTYVQADEGEEMANAYSMVSRVVEYLEGKTLTSEFFSMFSKMQEFNNVDEFKMYISQNGLHSDITVETVYDVEVLENFLSKRKNVWTKERKDQGGYYGFSIHGSVYSTLNKILGAELANDSLIFERTSDDQARFCLANKDFLFGICVYSIEGEASITKFTEANDFFDLNIK